MIIAYLCNELKNNITMKDVKYYYEVHVCGKNGFSVCVVSDVELDVDANDDEIILLGYEQDKLEGDDCHYVDYIEELTNDEYKEHFVF